MARKYVLKAELVAFMGHVNAGMGQLLLAYNEALLKGQISADLNEAMRSVVDSYNRFLSKHQPPLPGYCGSMSIPLAKTTIFFQPTLLPTVAKCFSDYELWNTTALFQILVEVNGGIYRGFVGEPPHFDPVLSEPETLSVPQFDDIIAAPAKAAKTMAEIPIKTIAATVPPELKEKLEKVVKAIGSIPEEILKEKRRQERLLIGGLVVAGIVGAAWLAREVKR